MYKLSGWVLSLWLCAGLGFANMNDDLNVYQAQGVQQAASISNDTLETIKANSSRLQAEHQTLIGDVMTSARHALPMKKQIQPAPNAILFVSFSMPAPLLFALCDEAAVFNIPVVVRGLVDGDFKKTIETFARLNRDAQTQHLNFKGISIDPLWFQQFQITSVPALVLSTRPGNCEAATVCTEQRFDVVYGNASIKNGLELIRDKGQEANTLAQTILEQHHV